MINSFQPQSRFTYGILIVLYKITVIKAEISEKLNASHPLISLFLIVLISILDPYFEITSVFYLFNLSWEARIISKAYLVP